MSLQLLTKSKIDQSFGVQILIETLQYICKFSTSTERFYINTTIIYFRSLYAIELDLINDLIEYNSEARLTLDILKSKHQNLKCQKLETIINIIEYNINYVANIKKIS